MNRPESLTTFYQHHGHSAPGADKFFIHRINDFNCTVSLDYYRRGFYKISLVMKAEGELRYGGSTILLNGPAISFFNPLIAYSWEPTSTDQEGYFCLFTEDFVNAHLQTGAIAQSPLFRTGGNHVFRLEPGHALFLQNIFKQMNEVMNSDYQSKYELVRSYVQIVMHEALRLQPATDILPVNDAAARITKQFIDALDKSFLHTSMAARTAAGFAELLGVHVNHLNRALKEKTGKTTSEWINEKLLNEARSLLLHQDMDIAEIGYRLGFEHPSNFISFFKKQTGQTPLSFRRSQVVFT